MPHETKQEEKCVRLVVPQDTCYLRFIEDWKGYAGSKEIGTTVRGESVIADYDKDGNIIGLELFNLTKPCQR